MSKAIVCERCGKREKRGKCHERVTFMNEVFYLCVDCSQIAYKIKDAITDGDSPRADALVRDFLSLPNTLSETLSKWFDDYKTRIGYSSSDEQGNY